MVEIVLVAANAQRAVQLVVIVDVAVDASPWRDGMRPGQQEAGLGMVELPVRPNDRVVARLAVGREPLVWDGAGRIVVIALMA